MLTIARNFLKNLNELFPIFAVNPAADPVTSLDIPPAKFAADIPQNLFPIPISGKKCPGNRPPSFFRAFEAVLGRRAVRNEKKKKERVQKV